MPRIAEASWAGRLSAPARQVHYAVLSAFAATGQALSPAEIERVIGAGGGDPDGVRAELAEADLLAFTVDGEVRAAYPFSPAPTPVRVSWASGPEVYAMCAIDALGMSAMLGRPVSITAAEPETGRRITVAVDNDRSRWTPRTAVVFVGAAGDAGCLSVDRSCGYISFFTTARAARAWAGRHPEITGRVRRRGAALRSGVSQFGTMLQPPGGEPLSAAQ